MQILSAALGVVYRYAEQRLRAFADSVSGTC